MVGPDGFGEVVGAGLTVGGPASSSVGAGLTVSSSEEEELFLDFLLDFELELELELEVEVEVELALELEVELELCLFLPPLPPLPPLVFLALSIRSKVTSPPGVTSASTLESK
jgi:hypothetical protein